MSAQVRCRNILMIFIFVWFFNCESYNCLPVKKYLITHGATDTGQKVESLAPALHMRPRGSADLRQSYRQMRVLTDPSHETRWSASKDLRNAYTKY